MKNQLLRLYVLQWRHTALAHSWNADPSIFWATVWTLDCLGTCTCIVFRYRYIFVFCIWQRLAEGFCSCWWIPTNCVLANWFWPLLLVRGTWRQLGCSKPRQYPTARSWWPRGRGTCWPSLAILSWARRMPPPSFRCSATQNSLYIIPRNCTKSIKS